MGRPGPAGQLGARAKVFCHARRHLAARGKVSSLAQRDVVHRAAPFLRRQRHLLARVKTSLRAQRHFAALVMTFCQGQTYLAAPGNAFLRRVRPVPARLNGSCRRGRCRLAPDWHLSDPAMCQPRAPVGQGGRERFQTRAANAIAAPILCQTRQSWPSPSLPRCHRDLPRCQLRHPMCQPLLVVGFESSRRCHAVGGQAEPRDAPMIGSVPVLRPRPPRLRASTHPLAPRPKR